MTPATSNQTTTPIYKGMTFYVPRFEISLKGQDLEPSVIQDVKEVSYTDSLTELDAFEFVLHDWDPVKKAPKYSSPYDANGNPQKLPDGSDIPNFDPGVDITLKMGYHGPDELTTMLSGKIVTISPSFPANGMPSLRVRALNPMHSLLRRPETMNFEDKTDSEIAQEIARSLDIEIKIPPGQIQDEKRYEFMSFSNKHPINFLMGQARRLGYDLHMEQPEEGDPFLFFGRSAADSTMYELEWGQSLASFTPTVRTRGQVTRLTVRGWRPGARGRDRTIVGTATFADLELNLPDNKLVEAIDSAIREFEEQQVEDPIENQAEADAKALGMLRTKVQDLITGNGTTVGFPQLRAGKSVAIKGVGSRYSGRYLLTSTTHKFDANGYVTELTARLEEKL